MSLLGLAVIQVYIEVSPELGIENPAHIIADCDNTTVVGIY